MDMVLNPPRDADIWEAEAYDNEEDDASLLQIYKGKGKGKAQRESGYY